MIGYASLDETRRLLFSTQNSSGDAADAGVLPTVSVYEQGTLMGAYVPVVTNKAIGLYEVALVLTTANGFEVGKEYSAAAIASLSGRIGRIPIASFIIDPKINRGVTSGVPTTTVIPSNLTHANADHWKDAWLLLEDGALAGEVKRIGASTIGGQITLAAGYAFSAAPAASVNCRIINR